MRTVATLANEAADAALYGVASISDIDLAMKAGLNYPEGPLRWSDNLGFSLLHTVLTHIQQSYGEDRYRPALLLRKTGLPKRVLFMSNEHHAPDAQNWRKTAPNLCTSGIKPAVTSA